MSRKWTLVNAENVKPYVCDAAYSSKQLTGDEICDHPVININEGTLQPHTRTEGGAHDDAEIYYIVDGVGDVWLDDDRIPVKNGDIIVIPPHVFHWVDNTKSDKPFVLFTFWPTETQNGMYFVRKKGWGTTKGDIDPDYTDKRLQGK